MSVHLQLIPVLLSLFAPMQGDATRQIVPEEFVKARPAKPAAPAPKAPAYQPAGARPPAAAKAPATPTSSLSQLGLTLWRLRASTSADAGARIIVQEAEKSVEWTPERVDPGTPLRIGERIRFSFESPQEGYLYVIDREQYADGSLGEPYLIFPTTRTRNGDNRVAAGRVIEIPGQDDRPNYFTMRQSRDDHAGELLTVLVCNRPLEGVTIGEKAAVLTNEQVEGWEKKWGGSVERFEMVGGTGKTWTRAEQAAGADGTRLLTQEDPGPQTIYRVAVKPGDPILVKVGLRYRPQTK